MKFSEKTLSSKTVYDGKIFEVCTQQVLLNDNSTAVRDVVIHHGGAGVLAIDSDNCVFLVRQYRKGAECEMLEIPAGKLEKGEDPEACAVRELREEIGAEAGNIQFLGSFFPTPAYCSEKIHIYFAADLSIKEQQLDKGEFLEVVKLPFKKAVDMAVSGEITDAKTIIALLKADALLKK